MVGDTVLGRFRLLERIGSGGFGTVYRGLDLRLERPVAVKVIESRGRAARRVLREAQAAARLNHPGIVTLYELGETGGRAYLVSELVEGDTLDRLAAEGGLSDLDVAELGIELCEALEHAHEHGVLHRDIKPQNVVVRDKALPTPAAAARAKLMDFGTAALVDGPALTATGEVIGTMAYMAPEQAEGASVGEEADVYALGLSLRQCWTGDNPFSRQTPAATARAIGDPFPPLASERGDMPPELCGALDACLAPDPGSRPTVRQLRSALERSAAHLDATEPVPAPSTDGLLDDLLAPPSPRSVAVARVASLAALTALVVWLGAVAGRPGAALVVAVLLLPAPLLLPGPAHWVLPAAAPLLGAIGIAPVYPALAALAGNPARRAVLAALGWAWLVAAEAMFGSRLLFGTADSAPDAWSASLGGAATGVLFPILTPESIVVGLVWVGAAVVLGALLRGRLVALELLAAIVWAAGLVALHGALAQGGPEPAAAPLTVALVAVAVVALWARAGRGSRPARGVGPPSLDH